MTFQITPHINFRGEARAALGFYHQVFGGSQTIVTHGDAHNPEATPAEATQVMWGQVAADSGFRVMAFDVPSARPYDAGSNSFFIVMRASDATEVERTWKALSEGATVLQPLAPAQWSPLYGMLRDRFGVTWVVDLAQEPAVN